MALSTTVKNFTAGSITLSDATGTPISITVALDEGDFSIEGLSAVLNEMSHYETRGKYNNSAYTTRRYPTFSFSAKVAEFTEATTGTIADAILKNGPFASGVSTLGTGARTPWALDLAFALETTDYGDSTDGDFALADCTDLQISFAEGDPDMFQITGTVMGAVTGDLAVAELPAVS